MTFDQFISDWQSPSPTLLVHTSGSTGKPKPMLVEKSRMEASARITCRFLGLQPGDTALLCMPLDYIAGKMVCVRSLVWNLRLIRVEPCGHPLQHLDEVPTFAAMVPMQVYNSLQADNELKMLKQIKHLIIGGGAISHKLEATLRTFPNAVWSTYGMTETLSHIALRRLSGDNASEWYTPFDGVDVSLNQDGCLVINAPEVCATTLTTNDIAEIDSDGRRFRIRGRRDNVVCSGGIKMQIEEIEAKVQAHTDVPLIITKRADEKFGEIIVLLAECNDIEPIKELCRKWLSKYEQPHAYISDGRRFRIRGRRDNVVCSGGIKMQIEEIEAKVQAHTDVPLIITKRADEKFGEIIVLLAECNDIEPIKELCRKWLSKYEQPHAYICVEHLPQTATGKPARAEAMRIASDYMIK